MRTSEQNNRKIDDARPGPSDTPPESNNASRITQWHKTHANKLIRAILDGDTLAIMELFSETLRIGRETFTFATDSENAMHWWTQANALLLPPRNTVVAGDKQQPRIAIFSDMHPDTDATIHELQRLTHNWCHNCCETAIQPEMVICLPTDDAPITGIPEENIVILPSVRESDMGTQPLTTGIPCVMDLLAYFDHAPVSIVHIATPGPLGLYAWMIAHIRKIPTIVQFHNKFIAQAMTLLNRVIAEPVLRSILTLIYQQSSSVLVTSTQAYRECLSLMNSPRRIKFIPFNVDTALFSPLRRKEASPFNSSSTASPMTAPANDASPSALRVVCELSAKTTADVQILHEAFDTLRERDIDVELVLLATGNQRLTESDWSTDIPVVVKYCHNLSACAQVLAWSDVFVFFEDNDPSTDSLVREAQACALPCISINTGAVSEWIDEDVTGFVIARHNVEFLAAAIAKFALDKELRECFGACARGKALARSKGPVSHLYQNYSRDLLRHQTTTDPCRDMNALHNVIRLATGKSEDSDSPGQITG